MRMDLRKFEPTTPREFVGNDQQRWCNILLEEAQEIKDSLDGNMKVLIKGPPGIGKTALSRAIAKSLVDEAFRVVDITEKSGADLQIEWVRDLKDSLIYAPMSGFRSIIINEADELPDKCETLFLQLMDDLPDRMGLFFTSNEDQLSQRFEDRCTRVLLNPPTPKEIEEWLTEHTSLSPAKVETLATKAKGMRSVINQAKSLQTAIKCKKQKIQH